MDLRKYRLIFGMLAMTLIVSGCTYREKEKAMGVAAGNLVTARAIREDILKDSSNTVLSPEKDRQFGQPYSNACAQ